MYRRWDCYFVLSEVDRLKQTSKQSDLIFRLFLYIPVVWAALLIAQSMGGGLPELLSKLTAALEHPFQIQWTDKSLLSILICTGAYIMGLCLYDAEGRRTRDGEEHGSAMWGSPKQVNAQFCQKQNKILTRHVRLGLDTHKHRCSLNVLVIGGSGAAKTRGYVKPNILEANTNYVITDPKMEVLTDTGGYLKQQGYDVRVLNLVNLDQSDGYNPFRYLRDEKDALKLVNTLIQATTPKGSHESDPFWTKSETALLQAIILMLHQEAPEYEQNFSMVMRVLEYAEVREDDDEYISPLDLLFRAIEHEDPESVALRQYRVCKQAAGKTAKSILISAAVRLAPFNLPQIKELYKDSWETIPGNSDTLLYLGGNEASTHKYISEALGKSTIDTKTHGQTKGRSGSYSTNFQMSGRELLTPDEVRMLDNRYCILFIRGARPVLDLKYELMEHPAIRYTMDGGAPPYIHHGAAAPALTGDPLFQFYSNNEKENAA